MQWRGKLFIGVSTLALTTAGFGLLEADTALARSKRDTGMASSTLPQEESVKLGDPYVIAGQRFEPKDDNSFDEVGYASVKSQAGGEATFSGDPYDPGTISASHRILPVPSYVEVTHLETGKTIVVRVNDRGPMAKDRVIDLSPAAAQLLGISGGTTAVRVRRVNPPLAEKAGLKAGATGTERLDTPPALLSALRRRLTETVPNRPKDGVMALPPEPRIRPVPAPRSGPAARPAPFPRPVVSAEGQPGATFEVPTLTPSATVPAPRRARPAGPAARPARPMTQPANPMPEGSDRFIIEDSNGRRTIVTSSGPVEIIQEGGAPVAAVPVETNEAVETSATSAGSGSYYVQIAAFGDPNRARQLASRAGGSVLKAGRIYRVRTGPYSDDASARAALSEAVSKGYRDARISR